MLTKALKNVYVAAGKDSYILRRFLKPVNLKLGTRIFRKRIYILTASEFWGAPFENPWKDPNSLATSENLGHQ